MEFQDWWKPILSVLLLVSVARSDEKDVDRNAVVETRPKVFAMAADRVAPVLADPFAIQADGAPIDIGKYEGSYGHAGPALADIDGDGDRDLLVGDFPGYFWHFDNIGTDDSPEYKAMGKLQTSAGAAKTPVY